MYANLTPQAAVDDKADSPVAELADAVAADAKHTRKRAAPAPPGKRMRVCDDRVWPPADWAAPYGQAMHTAPVFVATPPCAPLEYMI